MTDHPGLIQLGFEEVLQADAVFPGHIQSAGTKAGADADTAFFKQAKAKLGADAKISEVAKEAQRLKDQSASFEKMFGQPLERYMENGKLNMKDFLEEVVKPQTEPPAYVMSRVFGGDSVELLRDITGDDMHKWAQQAPRAERTAREAAAKTKNNGSGESAASQEAINRSAGEKAQGAKRVVVDTRSGIERPLIGTDAVDYKPGPYESVEFRGGLRDGEVIDQGRGARQYRRRH